MLKVSKFASALIITEKLILVSWGASLTYNTFIKHDIAVTSIDISDIMITASTNADDTIISTER